MAIDLGVFQSNSIDIGVFQTSSGTITPLNYTFTDSFTFLDNIIINCLPFADTLTLSDNAVVIEVGLLDLSDTLALSDTVSFTVGVPVNILSDGLNLTDSFIFLDFTNLTLNLSESFTFSEGLQIFTSNPLTISDNLVLSDSLLLGYHYLFSGISDELTLTDSVQLLLAPIANVAVTDALSLSDGVVINNASIFTPINLILTDSVALADGTGFSEITRIVLSDSLQLGDYFDFVVMTDLNPYLRRYLNDVIGTGNA